MNNKSYYEQKIENFDPNGLATGEGIFGLPFTTEDAKVLILPIPWEVTVSYRTGTAQAPKAILQASKQVDLYDSQCVDAWKIGVAMLPISNKISQESKKLRKQAAEILEGLEAGKPESDFEQNYTTINMAGFDLKEHIRTTCLQYLQQGKRICLLGGDHSTPLGIIEAMGEHFGEFGILHLDAHCDLRPAYEGFTYSHASIMYNALKSKNLTKLVQVGIRDFCEQEANLAADSKGRVVIHEWRNIEKARFKGENWHEFTEKTIAQLPQKVYVSFDIDGLNPALCPNTGTPVPGGLTFEESLYLIEQLKQHNKEIIGFDLNEVAPGKDEWDANVGARLLYRLCIALGKS